MITSECFAEIEAEAITLFERETKLEQADAQVTHDLVAEVRRLQAENTRTLTMATDYQALAAHREGEIDTLQAALKRADEDGAAAIERTSNAIIADKWSATAEFQARALKAEAEIERLQQDLEDARRMCREDMTDFDDEDPTS